MKYFGVNEIVKLSLYCSEKSLQRERMLQGKGTGREGGRKGKKKKNRAKETKCGQAVYLGRRHGGVLCVILLTFL